MKKGKPRTVVELTATWGNDDAESTIKVSRRRWQSILDGETFTKRTWSWYEGKRYAVEWRFSDGQLSIDGEDCAQYVVGKPASDLMVEKVASPERSVESQPS